MRRLFCALILAFAGALTFGCTPGAPTIETVATPPPDPVAEARAILTNYVNGMPVTSEAESFADLAKRVKEKDAAKGEALDKGLQAIKANPSTAKAKATELLKQL
jgi:hypothetical protein